MPCKAITTSVHPKTGCVTGGGYMHKKYALPVPNTVFVQILLDLFLV